MFTTRPDAAGGYSSGYEVKGGGGVVQFVNSVSVPGVWVPAQKMRERGKPVEERGRLLLCVAPQNAREGKATCP